MKGSPVQVRASASARAGEPTGAAPPGAAGDRVAGGKCRTPDCAWSSFAAKWEEFSGGVVPACMRRGTGQARTDASLAMFPEIGRRSQTRSLLAPHIHRKPMGLRRAEVGGQGKLREVGQQPV